MVPLDGGAGQSISSVSCNGVAQRQYSMVAELSDIAVRPCCAATGVDNHNNTLSVEIRPLSHATATSFDEDNKTTSVERWAEGRHTKKAMMVLSPAVGEGESVGCGAGSDNERAKTTSTMGAPRILADVAAQPPSTVATVIHLLCPCLK